MVNLLIQELLYKIYRWFWTEKDRKTIIQTFLYYLIMKVYKYFTETASTLSFVIFKPVRSARSGLSNLLCLWKDLEKS